MGFFKSIARNFFVRTALEIGATVATGNPAAGAAVGAALGAAGGGGVKGTVIGGIEGYGVGTATNAVTAGISAASAASTLGVGASGPVTSGLGSLEVGYNAAAESASSSLLGKVASGVSTIANNSGVKTAVNTAGVLAGAAGVYTSLSTNSAAKAAAQGGMVDPTAPSNDPVAIAAANSAADEEARRRARGQASTILTSPLGIGKNGMSASQLLLG